MHSVFRFCKTRSEVNSHDTLYESVFNQVSRIVFPLKAPINIQFMKFFKSRLFPVAVLLFSSFFALAQEQMTLADYQQAADLNPLQN